jgi:hypothetical protein
MKRFLKPVFGLTLPACVLALAACSGGSDGNDTGSSGNGNQTLATLDSQNVQAIGTSAAGILPSAIGSNEANTLIPPAELSKMITQIAANAANTQQANNLPAGVLLTSDQMNAALNGNYLCGGSVSVPDNANFVNGVLETTVTFNELCFNDTATPQTITMNGDVQVTITSATVTLLFVDFTVTTSSDSQTHAIKDTTVTCDIDSVSCTADAGGADGNNYDVADLDVSGNASDGYFVSATFTHPNYGAVEMVTDEPLFFDCPAQSQPSDGKISFTGENNSQGSIEFLDCASYSYCYDEDTTDATEPVCNTAMW